mmetsp:Transcript_9784/g.26591  ORF Transcript_9784/g.26591 Transcript_9784/m.26591 type:complete len:265 (-) Transcript_9784:2387-3181(-)
MDGTNTTSPTVGVHPSIDEDVSPASGALETLASFPPRSFDVLVSICRSFRRASATAADTSRASLLRRKDSFSFSDLLADTIEPSTRFCALCSFLMSDRMSSSRLRSASRRTSCSSTSVASRPRSDRACWTMSASTSSRSAMFKAQLRPGTPQMSLYVGWRLTSSNSTLAFSKTPVSPWYLSDVRTLWWVLASVSPDPPGPSRANVFMRAIPRAAPSMASVPVPSSSSRTRLLPVDSSRKPSMRLKCPLKVERLADRLCSSPMSA